MQFLSAKMDDNNKEDDEILEVYAMPRNLLPPLIKPVPVLDISLSVGDSDGHSVGDPISLSVLSLSVEASGEESVVGHSVGDPISLSMLSLLVEASGEESVSVGVSAEESAGLSVGKSAGLSVGKSPELSVQVEVTPPTTTNSESLSDDITRERDLQATMADETFISSMSVREIDTLFVDDWKDDESSFTTPTKKPASACNRPMSPVANRALHFPSVANSTLRPPPVPNRVLRPPPVAENVLTFPILNENHLQLHLKAMLKADRKTRQKEQKERWLAAYEAKKVLSYLIWYCFSVSD